MKKFLIAALVLCLQTLCFGQVEKGNWLVDSNFGLSYTSQKLTPDFEGADAASKTITTLTLNPSLNYFLIDNLAVGVGVKYAKIDSGEQAEISSLAVMPKATYFFKKDKLAPFLGLGVGYVCMGGKTDAEKLNGLAIEGQGGLAYFITNSVAATAVVNYTWSKLKNKENSNIKVDASNLGVGLGFSIFF